MKIKFLLAAGALALCAAPTTEARLGRPGRSLRWGGWNGAAAQAAAMAISTMSPYARNTLNGPSSGGYSPGLRNYNAPIVRLANDEDEDDLGRWGGWNGAAAQAAAMAISGFNGGQLNGPSSGGYNPGFRNYNAPIVRLANDEDEDDNLG